MQDVLTFGALIGAGGSIVAVITFWMNRGKAEGKAESAYSVASAAMAKVELLSSQLAEVRVEFARDYANHKDLAAAENRFASAVDGLREEFRGLNQRLDRILESLTEHRPKTPR